MKEYRQRYRPPWEILRARIDRMREASDDPELFNFEFSDPEEDTLSYADHHQTACSRLDVSPIYRDSGHGHQGPVQF